MTKLHSLVPIGAAVLSLVMEHMSHLLPPSCSPSFLLIPPQIRLPSLPVCLSVCLSSSTPPQMKYSLYLIYTDLFYLLPEPVHWLLAITSCHPYMHQINYHCASYARYRTFRPMLGLSSRFMAPHMRHIIPFHRTSYAPYHAASSRLMHLIIPLHRASYAPYHPASLCLICAHHPASSCLICAYHPAFLRLICAFSSRFIAPHMRRIIPLHRASYAPYHPASSRIICALIIPFHRASYAPYHLLHRASYAPIIILCRASYVPLSSHFIAPRHPASYSLYHCTNPHSASYVLHHASYVLSASNHPTPPLVILLHFGPDSRFGPFSTLFQVTCRLYHGGPSVYSIGCHSHRIID